MFWPKKGILDRKLVYTITSRLVSSVKKIDHSNLCRNQAFGRLYDDNQNFGGPLCENFRRTYFYWLVEISKCVEKYYSL
jgi:hypothetical protein